MSGLFLYFYFMKISQLHKLFLDCSSVSTDTRKISKNSIFFALKGHNFDGNTFTNQAFALGAKYVVIDDSNYFKNSQTILVKNVLETLQELATFHRKYLNVEIIAITGSNGKTTTKELINAVLSKQYNVQATIGNLNNHIGVPLTLLSMTKDTEIGIVEMGANHQKEIEFLCTIALPDFGYITNFGKAHLEGFGGIEGVIKGKSEMYFHLFDNNKIIFVNADDPLQIEKTKSARTIKFGSEVDQPSYNIKFLTAEPFVSVSFKNNVFNSNLIGTYNFSNISSAIAIGSYFKVSDEKIKSAIEDYIPENNRSQIITKGKTKVILDAYNANPTSMAAALHNFESQNHSNKIVILGDMFELGKEAASEHQSIKTLVESMSLNGKFLIGENFYKTKESSNTINYSNSFEEFIEVFKELNFDESLILIKGSRGMALERVLNLLD